MASSKKNMTKRWRKMRSSFSKEFAINNHFVGIISPVSAMVNVDFFAEMFFLLAIELV